MERPTPKNSERERHLLISLWVLAALFVALWKFRPRASLSGSQNKPAVEIDASLRAWFIDGSVADVLPGSYRIVLSWSEAYRDHWLALKADPTETPGYVTLAFQLRKGSHPVEEGATRCALAPAERTTSILIPNPEHHRPSLISLYLAH